MAAMTEITCACGCGQKRMVRTADVKRGWGKYINKRHKAVHQERRTGQYAEYLHRRRRSEKVVYFDHEHNSNILVEDEDQSWDAHKLGC